MGIPKSESQTLITGVYRTGSEFLAQLCGLHPDLDVSMYRVNALRFLCGQFDPIDDVENQKKALDFMRDRLETRYGVKFDAQSVLAEAKSRGIDNYAGLYDLIMSALYLQQSGLAHWAEKNQLMWREIPDFLDQMPNGRAVLILRDPRSVLASFREFTNAAFPRYLGAAFNCLDSMQHAKRLQSKYPDQFMWVRFEDLVKDGEAVCRSIWKLIGLNADVEFSNERLKEATNAYGESWKDNTSFGVAGEDFNAQDAVTRWHKNLSDEEIAFAEHICGLEMVDFGYELSANKAGLSDILKTAQSDEQISGFLNHWQKTGEGVEMFPSDPFDSSTWNRPL